MKRSFLGSLLAPALVVCTLSFARTASATDEFPGLIAKTLSAPVPACTICHATLEGGTGTVVKGFGIYMRSRGLAPNNDNSLNAALKAAEAEKHDTDNDGTPDLDAIKKGLDPNGNVDPSVAPIDYGCGNQITPRAPTSDALLAMLAVAPLALASRRRRRH